MKRTLLSFLVLLLFASTLSAQTPQFENAVKLKTADGEPIILKSSFSVPTLHDIDGDGDLDLFVGDYSGNYRVFINNGSNAQPAYKQPYLFQVGGETAWVPIS